MLVVAVLSAFSWLAFVVSLYFFVDENEKLDRALTAARGQQYVVTGPYVVALKEIYTIHLCASAMAVLNVTIALMFPSGSTGAAVFVVVFNCVAHALLFSTVERCRAGLSDVPPFFQ